MFKKSSMILVLLMALVLTLVGCSTGIQDIEDILYNPGTYTASAQGKMGMIDVEVIFSENSIKKVTILEHNETPEISDPAIENLPNEVVKNQSLEIDSISGATVTRDAIIKAIEDCILQSGGSLEVLKSNSIKKDKKKEVLEADIIVVGSGISGMSAGISALQNGASVIVVEKQNLLGRTLVTSFGNVMMAQVEENKQYHKSESDDILENAIDRWKNISNQTGKEDSQYPDYDRVKDIIIESGETINWLEKLGIPFNLSFTKEERGADIVRVEPDESEMSGSRMINSFIEKLEEYGATVLTNTAATEILEEDGKIVGIKATSADVDYEIRSKNTILATGGFGGNEDYVKELIPDIIKTGYQFTGTGANTGDGITMAKKVGASIYEDGWIIPSPGKLLPSKTLTDKNIEFNKLNGMSSLEGGNINNLLLIDIEGNRITNEAGQGVEIVADLIDSKNAPYYFLFDASSKEIISILESGIDTGDVIKADNIDELARQANMNNLLTTFNNYQDIANQGQDLEFNKSQDFLKPYSGSGPYYIARFVPDFVATMGGLKTTDEYQVVREDNTPIEGLYAIGELSHRFLYNRAHFGNASNSASLTMGRTLGEMLAENLKP